MTSLPTNHQELLARLKTHRLRFDQLPRALRGDKAFVMEAFKFCEGSYLHCVDIKLRRDEDVVMACVLNDGHALRYASQRLRGDERFVRASLKSGANYFYLATAKIKNDKAMCLYAVQKNAQAYLYVGRLLTEDKDIITLTLHSAGLMLQNMSKATQSNLDLVILAVKNNPLALAHASPSIRRVTQNASSPHEALEHYREAMREKCLLAQLPNEPNDTNHPNIPHKVGVTNVLGGMVIDNSAKKTWKI